MEAPTIDPAVKEQIRKEYADFDLEELLEKPLNPEERKNVER